MKVEKLDGISETTLDTIMTIWLTGNLEAHPFIGEQYWRDHEEEVKKQFVDADVYVVRDDDNQILGFAGMQDRYLAGIFVQSDRRDEGIGSLLMFALKSAYKLIKVSVYAKNTKAVHFFEQHGFETIERELDHETDEVEMRLSWHR